MLSGALFFCAQPTDTVSKKYTQVRKNENSGVEIAKVLIKDLVKAFRR